ncbi:ABC transporter ATP-binding protein [Georgenia sp. Z1491]|uniref:ABC transporter ATP-binding protein n=1 Tax=Georgenia sp. Z1491 TaxID=3416707 RepID=UPI003CFB556E
MDVRMTDLQLHYGDFHAVKDVTLSVDDGSALVLLGPSGCGKTSTMRTIAGLETPSGGRITIGGQPMFDASTRTNVAPNKRNVGMVFQSYAVWPHRTVRENVEFPLRVRRTETAARRRRGDEILALTGLTEYADRGASRLSGGQMQRVALARSLAMNPSVLLLDEPLSNLDALLRENLRNELRRIQQEAGITSVYVTHDQAEALALADRIAMMRAGRVVQTGTPAELFENPVDKDAARFMGFENILEIATGETPVRLAGRYVVPHSDQVADAVTDHETDGEGTPAQGREYLCVRAENVTLTAADDGGTGDTEAEISVVTYQGRSVEYDCVIDGDTTIRVKVGGSAARFSRGDRVRLAVDVEAARILGGGDGA